MLLAGLAEVVISTETSALDDALRRLTGSPRDEDAWRLLHRSARPFVLALSYRLLHGASALAEDAVQEVFYRLTRYGDFGQFPNARAFKAYLRVMCRNVINDLLKGLLQAPENQLYYEQPLRVPDEHVGILFRELERSVSAQDRKLLEMLLEGWTTTEISAAFGIAYSAAAVRVHRLRQRIKTILAGKSSRTPSTLL
jgi:RNA polymerase sigma factor (sigma-70 family)